MTTQTLHVPDAAASLEAARSVTDTSEKVSKAMEDAHSAGRRSSMDEELLRLLKRLNAARDDHSKREVFSNPAVIAAIVTGIISLGAAFLIHGFQSRQVDLAVQRESESGRLRDQHEMLGFFGRNFPRSLNLGYQAAFSGLGIWTQKCVTGQGVEVQDEVIESQRREYNRIAAEYLKEPNPLSLCAEVSAKFDSEAVTSRAQALRSLVDRLTDYCTERTTAPRYPGLKLRQDPDAADRCFVTAEVQRKLIADLEQVHQQANVLYLELLEEMGKEMRNRSHS